MFDRLTTLNIKENVIDVVNVVLGVCLALAPWALDFTAEATAAWNAWITGAAIALVALGAIVAFNEWEEWVNLALGVWAAIAPWAVAFSENAAASGVHLAVGIAVAVLAAARLWVHASQPTTSHSVTACVHARPTSMPVSHARPPKLVDTALGERECQITSKRYSDGWKA